MADPLSFLLDKLSLRAGVFYSGQVCGMFDYGDSSSSEGHLHVLRKGTLRINRTNETPLVISEPSVLFFPRPQIHAMSASEEDKAEVVCATVKYSVGMNNPLAQSLPSFIHLPLDLVPNIIHPIEGMLSETLLANAPGYQEVLNRYMEVFIVYLLRFLMHSNDVNSGLLSALADPSLSKAITAMHEDPAYRWSLQNLAERACQSRSKFASEFKQVVGVPVLEYLTHWRVSVGKALLLKGKQVTYVASEVGYESTSSFTKAFKKVEGHTPKAWLSMALAP